MQTPDNPLYQLARIYGIETSYDSAYGDHVRATEDALFLTLRRLGAPLEAFRPEAIQDALREAKQARWQRAVDPVTVAWNGQGKFALQASQSRPSSYQLALTLADGRTLRDKGELSDNYLVAQSEQEGVQYGRWHLPLPTLDGGALPLGRHTLTITQGKQRHQTSIYASPQQVFVPWQREDQKYWGAFLPLYALQRRQGKGTRLGHLGDLQEMIEWVAAEGGHMVGTLPLLASYLDWPCEPSPYAPASRLFWNELYLELEAIEEWQQGGAQAYDASVAAAPAALPYRPGIAPNDILQGPFAPNEVQHAKEMQHKRAALAVMAKAFFKRAASERGGFEAWRQGHPHAESYARFRTAMEQQRRPWSEWNTGWEQEASADKATQELHLYAQWQLHRQLTRLSEQTPARSLGLYLDLPLGVHPFSYDTWRYPESFCNGLSTGAPPDALQIRGQNWGFPPLHPEQIRQDDYAYLVDTYRNHMQYAGVLRIDHVMGLYRRFVVPDGMEATKGVYIRYQQDEIYALLSLESHQNKCLLLGENLGTVPRAVSEALTRHKVQRMYVAQFALKQDPTEALLEPVADCIASLNTHDTPTFAGFWQGQDLDVSVKLGLMSPKGVAQATRMRRLQQDTLGVYLYERGCLDEGTYSLADGVSLQELTIGTLRWLAHSNARIVLANMEDLWQETQPQNVPGTGNEWPNWRKMARLTFESMKQHPGVKRTFAALTEGRQGKPLQRPKNLALWPSRLNPLSWRVGAVKSNREWMNQEDLYLFNEGTNYGLYKKMGAHIGSLDGERGVHFAVWAPNAARVSVIGDFNGWDPRPHTLEKRGQSGVWTGFIPGVCRGSLYKYHIISSQHGQVKEKADPVGFLHEQPPQTASRVWDLDYLWNDSDWMEQRKARNALDAPISVYEVHLGSWLRPKGNPEGFLNYREIAKELAAHVNELGHTHVQLMPVMEHPFFGSWGYQGTGYYAPSARFGTPQDLMFLIDTLHQHDIGVFLDWVPSHFPGDGHGLAHFDGTHLYEHADPRRGFHPDWNSCIFNYGRYEVQSFLISSAMFWLEVFHIDGIRVDAVASMLYLDYSRDEGQWLPNKYGGRENLEAIQFLKNLNAQIAIRFPQTLCIAEESTAWPKVSRSIKSGGLGFHLKWDMGWMHDTLGYMAKDPIYRQFHHNDLTFRSLYAQHENFMLALSHDEVVHGKGSLLNKMPGNIEQKRAHLRLLFGYMYAQTGKKHLFMGSELGMIKEWNHDGELPWSNLKHPSHRGVFAWLKTLNQLYKEEPALHQLDHHPKGLRWVEANDAKRSVYGFLRFARDRETPPILVVCNFTPMAYAQYRLGVPAAGEWVELANSDAEIYGGTGFIHDQTLQTTDTSAHGYKQSLQITLPPLGVVFLKPTSWPPTEEEETESSSEEAKEATEATGVEAGDLSGGAAPEPES